MKLGVTVSTYPAGSGPIVFRDGDIVKNVEIIKKLGYDGVDIFADRKTDAEIDELRATFEVNGIEIAMYLAIFLAEMGISLSARDNQKRKQCIQEYKQQIEFGKRLGTRRMAVGYIRGAKGGDESMKECLDRLAWSLDELCTFAGERGITLCLEPINRYEINTLNNVDECLEFIHDSGLDNLGLLLDAFHMNIEESSIEGSIMKAGTKIKHFHSPDSHRLATGTGHLNYDSILKTLASVGYNEYLVLEAFPKPNAVTCASMSAAFLKQKLAIVSI